MRVLVTGANGCIGSWVVKQLLDRRAEVLIYDLDPSPSRIEMIAGSAAARTLRIEQGAIEDTARVKALVKDEQITHIVHLAAVLMPFCQQNPVAGALVNVIGTLNVFEAARDAGRPVRIVYASSSAVWGPEDAYEDRKLNEGDPLHPATHYGVYKQANEGNAHAFYLSNGISSVGLRPWAVYGFGREFGLTADPTLAIKALARNEPFCIRISGDMDLQYVEDVAEIFVRCLLSDKPGAHVFNLAGQVIAMEEFPALLERVRPGASALITAGGNRVPVATRMDDARLRAYLGGVPETSVEAGVRRTLDLFARHSGSAPAMLP
jgi:nucleoside-diphosphate-sugar epimerase